MAILEVHNLKKIYTTRFGGNQVQALSNISFELESGEFVAIMGESGSGKTTLLNILAALDRPTSGQVLLNGKEITKIPEGQLAAFRRENLGFVFQDFNLLDTFSIQDNILLPLVLAGIPHGQMRRRLDPLAVQLGLTELLKKFPYEVSGGQKQRAAVARALITNPQLILADEPTGALDSHTGREVLGMLQELHNEGHTVVLITHDNSIAVQAERIIRLEDGRVVYDGDSHSPEAVVQPTLLPEQESQTEEAQA